MRKLVLVGLIVLAAGCKPERTPEEQARQDERDIQMVKDAQKRVPPVRRVQPEPISFADATGQQVTGAGCGFRPAGSEAADPILYNDSERAVLRVDGQPVVLAADSGSAEFPYGSREHYSGKEYDLRLTKEPGDGTPSGEESATWTATVTLRDRWDRPAYTGAGTLYCGA